MTGRDPTQPVVTDHRLPSTLQRFRMGPVLNGREDAHGALSAKRHTPRAELEVGI